MTDHDDEGQHTVMRAREVNAVTQQPIDNPEHDVEGGESSAMTTGEQEHGARKVDALRVRVDGIGDTRPFSTR